MSFSRSGPLYWRWDRLPRPAEWRDMETFRTGRELHQRLWDARYTMLSSRRARALHRLATEVHRKGIPGALVDCGVWNGGSTVLMALGAPDRDVWAFDSFAGLPEPSPVDGTKSYEFAGECVGSPDMVREGVEHFGARARLHIREGWFEDTFPTAAEEIGPIALLHCDGDWYESVRLTLETFYPQVSAGGFVVIDDYGAWPGAKRATNEYRRAVGDRTRLRRVDHTGRYWRRPAMSAS